MPDWRTDNAKWTRGAIMRLQKYSAPRPDWDHDHCEGCWAKFMESGSSEIQTEGYVTEDNRWISTLLLRNLSDVFGENDPVRRHAAIDEIFHYVRAGVRVGILARHG